MLQISARFMSRLEYMLLGIACKDYDSHELKYPITGNI